MKGYKITWSDKTLLTYADGVGEAEEKFYEYIGGEDEDFRIKEVNIDKIIKDGYDGLFYI